MHEDVKQHLAKAGTPTMGGTVFLVVAILVSLIFNFHVFSEGHQAYGATAGILFVILIYGIIGFLDDFLKISSKSMRDLNPWQKMALQIIAGLLFYFIHVLPSGTDSLVIWWINHSSRCLLCSLCPILDCRFLKCCELDRRY